MCTDFDASQHTHDVVQASKVQYITMSSSFLTKTFENTEENEKKIALPLKTDKLIMIMATKQVLNKVAEKIPFTKRKHVFVVSVLTFHSETLKPDSKIAAFVSYLAVTNMKTTLPYGFEDWRHLGFGSLMINFMIKHFMTLDSPLSVYIYLQCDDV